MRHKITLHAMRFHALVGILPHERTTAQPIEIDLRVTLTASENSADGGAPASIPLVESDCADVVDYRELYDIVAGVMASGPIDFLEEVGERIARGALESSPHVAAVRVAVRKPHVALGGPLDYAEVVTELGAND